MSAEAGLLFRGHPHTITCSGGVGSESGSPFD